MDLPRPTVICDLRSHLDQTFDQPFHWPLDFFTHEVEGRVRHGAISRFNTALDGSMMKYATRSFPRGNHYTDQD
jgi:hypothetical protein